MIAKVTEQHAIDAPQNRDPAVEILESVQPFLDEVNAGSANVMPNLRSEDFSL